MLPTRCIVGHLEKAMNPLCVAITYGAIEELEPIIKRLEAISPRTKGEQECLDAALKRHGSWVSQSEIQSLFDKTPPHRFAGIEGFMESKLHIVLDEVKDMCVVCGKAGELEPRFGYVVCKDHENIPPNQVHKHACPVFPTEQSPAGEKTIPSSILPIRPTGDN